MNASASTSASAFSSAPASTSTGSSSVSSAPASLPSPALARRLGELCGDERNLQVDFLLHLAEFDSRMAWAEAGYGSLWAYCVEVLHLREGATYRRIEAMKLLRRFPVLEAPLRAGKLCLTTVCQLGAVLTDDNLESLVARAAFLSKAETARLVVEFKPEVAPRDGVRKVSARSAPAASVMGAGAAGAPKSSPVVASVSTAPALALAGPERDAASAPSLAPGRPPASAASSATAPGSPSASAPASATASPPASTPAPAPARAEVRPVSADTYSLRVTLDAEAKAELDRLVSLLSHKTRGNLAEVIREAVRCGIAKHGKRRGAVAPERRRAAPAKAKVPPARSNPRYIPPEVKRAVQERDGGRCAWVSPDGKRCGSRDRLEFGHVQPVALGGKSTVENVRLECKPHNTYEAVRVFGAEHMATYLGRVTSSSEGHPR